MSQKRRLKDGGETTGPAAPPPGAPLKPNPLNAAAITPAEASPPDPPPEAPPKGIAPELWQFCQLGHRIKDRVKQGDLGVKKACEAQLKDEPRYKNYTRVLAESAYNVATRLKPEDWDRLGQIKFPKGKGLTRTHLQELTQKKDRRLIEKLLNGLERGCWTSGEIRHKAHAFKGKTLEGQANRGGHQRTVPKTLEDGLESLTRHSEEWLKDHDLAAQGRNAWLDLPAAGTRPDDLLDQLVNAGALLRRLAKSAYALEDRVHKLDVKVRSEEGGSVP